MTTTTTRTRTRPRVVIDANPVGYPFISRAVGPARAVVSIAKEFVEAGIDVIIVCDNQNKRHHSKRATIQRRGVIERGKIQLVEKRIILSNLLRSSTSSSPDSLKNIKTIQREIKKLEKGTGQILPTDFVEQIQQQVQHYESNRTSKSIVVVIAPFQADPEVARRVICGDADCIVSIDSDYQMLLGSSTPNDITIRHIILNNSTLKIRTAVLVTGQKKVRDWIAEVLPTADNKPYFPKAPPCPIFDKLNDPTCRAMLAVALGSDVFCGGVNKFGPQKAYTIKQQIDKLDSDAKKQQHIISSIIKYKTDTNININALLCYTQALLYELTCDGYMYKDDKPERLDAYLKEFKCYETTTITDGVSILTCPGLNNNNHSEHNFIPFCEGEYLCNKCNKIYCQYCTYDTNTDGGSFICIQCKFVSLSINTSSLPTEAVMRKELMNAGTDVPASATYIDVVDTYEESKESGTLSLPVDYSRVPFPLEPSSIFHVSQNKLQDVSEPKIMTDINHFIHDNNINSTNKAKFVTIEASFVDLSSCGVVNIDDSHNTNSDYYETPRKQKGTKRTARNNYYTGESSLFTMKNLTCTEIKRRTGYADISALLSFVVVVCGGEMDVIIKTCSKLTWLEEWILYLQYIYGHSIKRWVDYAKEYNLKMEYCRRIFRSKLEIVITARKRWPMYATHREDVLFRDSKWENDVGNDTRIIMHDNTNVSLPTASDGDQQRSLYSEYYGECCAKGGVCIQFCGWIRSTHLVTGHACDKTSTELTKVLPQQQQFQEHDKINNAIVPFLLILDKGYRITMLAKEYNQGCWQPIFAKSDEQFQRNHLLLSAGVAVNRSGNERGVKYMKLSRLIGQGVKYGNFDLATVDDIWLAWGFQVNFMYQTVL